MKKRIINTSVMHYKEDLGITKLEKKIEKIKKEIDKESGCLYAFIDIKKEFVPNGVLYIGQSKSIKNRMVFYRSRNSELLVKFQKRFNLWIHYWGMGMPDGSPGVFGPSERQEKKINKFHEFIRDEERCKLIIKISKNFQDQEIRKQWEKSYIKRYKPLLNQEAWHPFLRSGRRFYMNQLHLDPAQRNKTPVYCLHTHTLRDNPTEDYIKAFNQK